MTQSTQVKQTFDNLGISPKMLNILSRNNFTSPTPIQHQCIPSAILGKDIIGIAQTGTGKTLAFGVPIIQRLAEQKGQALILVPTRELAIQAEEMLYKIGRSFGLKTAVIIGGASSGSQISKLNKNPHIVVATPGRLIDYLDRKIFNLNQIKIIVLDEADRMFDIGFLPDIKRILEMAPTERQTLLFSATMPSAVSQIAERFMNMPVRIEVAPSGTIPQGVEQEFFILDKQSKLPLLEKILGENTGSVLVFSRTKYAAKKISKIVGIMGHTSSEIHSNRSLSQRKEAMAGFKSGKYRVLVATDIASRGIDVSGISLVVNYDLPQNSEDYVHRIGRTGRAGLTGKAVSFATPDQRGDIKQIERLIKKTISILAVPRLPKSSDAVMQALYHASSDRDSDRDNDRGFSHQRAFSGFRSRGNFMQKRQGSTSKRRSSFSRFSHNR